MHMGCARACAWHGETTRMRHTASGNGNAIDTSETDTLARGIGPTPKWQQATQHGDRRDQNVASEACHPGATEAEPRQSTNVAFKVLHSCDMLANRVRGTGCFNDIKAQISIFHKVSFRFISVISFFIFIFISFSFMVSTSMCTRLLDTQNHTRSREEAGLDKRAIQVQPRRVTNSLALSQTNRCLPKTNHTPGIPETIIQMNAGPEKDPLSKPFLN